jgi:hypothetical protein
MSDQSINHTNLNSLLSSHDPSKPISMLNLWRYRSTAIYPASHAHLSSTPCTGEEAMACYIAALQPLMPPGSSVQFTGKVLANVVAPEEEEIWDVVAIVRYETLEGFVKMVESVEYGEVERHKGAALEGQRLVVMEEFKTS